MSARNLTVAMMNVVTEGDYQYEQEIPLGIACVGAYLRDQEYNVIFKQCFVRREGDTFALITDENEITGISADIYGFQLNTVNYHPVRTVVAKIKSVRPESISIFGGPFLCSKSEEILKEEPLYDFIILGEGEVTTLELLKAVGAKRTDLHSIDGLVWRNESGDIIRNRQRCVIEDLDTLPFPARDLLEDAKRDLVDGGLIESVRMISSRGCVGNCSFCAVNFYHKVHAGKRWRGRSPERVIDEVEYLSKRYSARVFNFSDSSFEDPGKLGKVRSRRICEGIIRRGVPFSAKVYLRCDSWRGEEDIELLKLYKEAGVDVVIIGSDAANDSEIKLYGKKATVEDNHRTAKILRDLDLFYVLTGFIMFGPNSTEETLRENIEFLHKYDFTDNINFVSNVLMLIRDSEIYDRLKREGRVIETGRHWELPKYKIRDPLAARVTGHWESLLVRFPNTREVHSLQTNIGNLIARMTNRMNRKVFEMLQDEYLQFKNNYEQLNKEVGKRQYEYFNNIIDLISDDCTDERLREEASSFFDSTYGRYRLLYSKLYDRFLNRINDSGVSLSGLVFRHFLSALAVDGSEKVRCIQ
ncbi:MAG: radical SAM protein [Candidatus Omnitrophota bacterium]